jgi:Ca2+-binding RTX toxin-like protein
MSKHQPIRRRLLQLEPLECRRVWAGAPLYRAHAALAMDNLALNPADADVVQLAAGEGAIDLGSRTFTLYATRYTGEQAFVTASGMLTFGDRDPVFNEPPTEPAVRVLSGVVSEATVLYTFRDYTSDGEEDLLVDWIAADASMRFQVVLQLGTGDRQGAMLFNYPDIDDPSRPAQSHARSATVSVEGSGDPADDLIAYTNGLGNVGLRSGMGLVVRDDALRSQVVRFGNAVHVFATLDNDRVALDFDGAAYIVQRNNQQARISTAIPSDIYLHGTAGSDLISVANIRAGDRIGLDGGWGDDTLVAPPGAAAMLWGAAGNDRLTGSSQGDGLEGGPGNDLIVGGAGGDVYYFADKGIAHEADVVGEASDAGVDTLDFSMSSRTAKVDLQSDALLALHLGVRTIQTQSAGQAANFENATGGAGNDVFIGNDAANILLGDAGNDRLEAKPGDDLLDGGSGEDTLIGGRGNDTYRMLMVPAGLPLENDALVEAADQGTDTLDFSALQVETAASVMLWNTNVVAHQIQGGEIRRTMRGNGTTFERAIGGAGDDNMAGNLQSNELLGNDGNDVLGGLGGNDLIYGGAGADSLYGHAGNDLLDGGTGDDIYYFEEPTGNEIDKIFERFGGGIDELNFAALSSSKPVTVNLSQNNLATHAGRKVWTGIRNSYLNFEAATGGEGDDTLIGNIKNNRLVGGPGEDTFDGRGGTDEIVQ